MGIILFSKGSEANWCFILLWVIHQISTSFKDQNKLQCQQCHFPHRPATGISPHACLSQGTLRDAHQKLHRYQSASGFTEAAGENSCIAALILK